MYNNVVMQLYDFLAINSEYLLIYSTVLKLVFLAGALNFISALGYLLKGKGSGKFYRASRYSHYSLTAALTLLFIILIEYHLTLSSITYFNPFEGGMVKFYIPVWIEKEKLLFWLWIYTMMVIYAERYRLKKFLASLYLGSSAFLIIIYLTNSFVPLPEMSTLIKQYLIWQAQPYFNSNAVILFKTIIGKYYLYTTGYMWIHPPMIFIAYAAFTVNFFANIFLIIKKDYIYDRVAYAYAKFGYFLLTVGLLIGYPWALKAWHGQSWWWSPIISSSFVLWFFYSAYLHSRLYIRDRGMLNVTAAFGILGYLGVILAYLVVYLLPGVHAYA